MSKSAFRILGRTTLTAYLFSVLFLLALAFGLYRFQLTEGQVQIGINAIYVIACLVAGIMAGKLAKTRRFLWGFAAGTVYFLILLTVSFLLQRQLDSSLKELALVFAMCAGSGTIGGMIS